MCVCLCVYGRLVIIGAHALLTVLNRQLCLTTLAGSTWISVNLEKKTASTVSHPLLLLWQQLLTIL